MSKTPKLMYNNLDLLLRLARREEIVASDKQVFTRAQRAGLVCKVKDPKPASTLEFALLTLAGLNFLRAELTAATITSAHTWYLIYFGPKELGFGLTSNTAVREAYALYWNQNLRVVHQKPGQSFPCIHPEFGAVEVYATTGLGCADCSFDAHTGDCKFYTCGKCGVDCIDSGCSQHGSNPRVTQAPRKLLLQKEQP